MAVPLQIDSTAASGWSNQRSLILSLANWWASAMPRGRGAVPRFLGRLVGQNQKLTCTTKNGAALAIAPRALDIYSAINRKGGCWDTHVFDTCRSLLKPGQVLYDLGASVGYMTVEMATVFHGEITCVAFEPQPDLARCVAISAAINGLSNKVAVFELMLGDTPREETLMLTSHSVHASTNAVEAGGTALKRQMTTIDELVAHGDAPPPDVMKLDIEGGELQALRGAQNVIRAHRPHVVFEINACAERFGYTRQDVFDLLQSLGEYEFFEISPEGATLPLGDKRGTDDVLARSVSRMT
jgi:FkbM family methyltransferase